jgi:hypothetical protein
MSNPEAKPGEGASTVELVSSLGAQTTRLIRDELRLAQREFQDSAKHAGIGAGLLSVAGLIAAFGAACLVASAIAALSLVLPVWAAALIVAAVLFMVAGIAGLSSKKQLSQASPTPELTVQSVKRDIEEVNEARHEH